MNKKTEVDHYYYNVVMDFDNLKDNNFPHRPVPAIYNVQPSQAILQNPHEFYLSVIRFQIPVQQIPIFFEVGYNGGIDPNKSFKSVTIQVGASVPSQVFLEYIPQDLTIPVPTAPITPNNIMYYSIYSYQQFVNEINVALAAAFTAAGPPVLVPPLQTPYMIYDATTELFSIIVDQRFPSNNIHIYFNTDLYVFFQPSFNVIKHGDDQPFGEDYELIIQNNNNNNYIPSPAVAGVNFYQFKQEERTMDNITTFRTIVVLINNVPIRYEFIPPANSSNSAPTFNTLPILTDFLPLLSNSADQMRTYVTYYPTGQYRLTDLLGGEGSSPIERIQIQIFWGDKYDNLYPLLITPHDKSNLKLLFVNKKLYKVPK